MGIPDFFKRARKSFYYNDNNEPDDDDSVSQESGNPRYCVDVKRMRYQGELGRFLNHLAERGLTLEIDGEVGWIVKIK